MKTMKDVLETIDKVKYIPLSEESTLIIEKGSGWGNTPEWAIGSWYVVVNGSTDNVHFIIGDEEIPEIIKNNLVH